MTHGWVVRRVWSLKSGAAFAGDLLEPEEAAKVAERIEREQAREMVEHGVRIPAWSDDAKVIWNRGIDPPALAQSKESREVVRRMVGLATKRGVA